jgi:SPW repeat
MNTQKPLSWLIVVGGAWEVAAPFVFGATATTAFLWDAVIIGVALVILGAWAALSAEVGTDRNLDWLNAVLGLWLIAAPFVLGYSGVAVALWNDIVVGIIIAVLGAWAALALGQQQHPKTM